MSRLLREIKQQDEAAAAVLEKEGLLTDSDIQTLTREELNELFAGRGYLKLRRTIFEIIHKKKPVDQVLKELKEFIPHESFRDALTNNGVLVDYLHILKDMKTQMNHVQSFLDAHICLLEGFSTNQPNQQSATCGPDPVSHNGQPDRRQQGAPGEVMSRLLSEIKQQDEAAAAVLEALVQIEECLPNTTPVVAEAELHTDLDIQSLTREELNELFPGNKKFQLRRTIFKIIHKQKPVDQVLKELKEFIPSDSFRDALTNNGVLVDYLPILKTQMNHVQSFLDAHICLLEGISTNQPDQQSDTCGPDPVSHNGQPDGLQQGAPDSLPGPGTSDASGEMGHYTGPTGGYPQGPQSTSPSATDGPRESHNGQSDGIAQGARGTGTLDASTEMEDLAGQTGGYPQGLQSTSTSATDGQVQSHNDQTDGGPQGARAKLKYRMVVSGKTFDAHLNLMQRVKDQVQNQLQLDGSSQDHEITFVFCPICSRVASDVEAAMTDVKGTSTSATDELMEPEAGPQRATAKLKYRMVVSGKTFDAHLNLMQRVKDQVQNQLQLDGSSQDHEITFVFCPICSRVASDVEAAMTDVKVSSDDKPVILVLMHHTREVKYTSSLKTWHDNNNVVLFINVFYHETIKGLLNCEENNAAVSKIQNELVERFLPGSIDSRGNPQGMGAGGLTGDTSGRGGGNDRGSGVDSRSSGRGMFQSMCDYISSKK
ncbi:uncharacterized protein si:ch211-245h14.1 isoform X3 [Sebastes umbrosus]|uniref:uncharacterized protein si:ch211-245h14.1 isoform X3 n=1 Tax=Sebastes umbrosus TaxID=72105 RepID=UPI0018A048EB|nr:uncharacterized protein si:ch211-245h14.1 isoform X3 [Sebastes umbrosus]